MVTVVSMSYILPQHALQHAAPNRFDLIEVLCDQYAHCGVKSICCVSNSDLGLAKDGAHMLGVKLSVPMALGRKGWQHTFPVKFTKRGQERLQILGFRGCHSSGFRCPAQVFASSSLIRADRGRRVYGTRISSMFS